MFLLKYRYLLISTSILLSLIIQPSFPSEYERQYEQPQGEQNKDDLIKPGTAHLTTKPGEQDSPKDAGTEE